MNIAVVGCFHETNTFSPGITEKGHFNTEWVTNAEQFVSMYENTKTSMGATIDASINNRINLLPLFYTQTIPSSIVKQETAEEILQIILDSLNGEKEKIDGIIFILHGAMVSEEWQDVEGEYLKAVRSQFPQIPISVTIDLHANISDAMVESADFIVGYKTYPHIDAYDRSIEAFNLLVKQVNNEVTPTSILIKTNILMAPMMMNTNVYPMKDIIKLAQDYEKENDVLHVTVAGGFSFADVFCAGITIVVTTNQNIKKAQQIGKNISHYIESVKESFRVRLDDVTQIKNYKLSPEMKPTILIESSDNVGGGSPGDATHTLRYLIEQKIKKFLIVITDPDAVQYALTKKIGRMFQYEVGGKLDAKNKKEPLHGIPILISGKIKLLSDGVYYHKGPYMSGVRAQMGKTAVISIDELDATVVLTSERVAPWDINHVKSLGISPDIYSYIVVKSSVAWRTAFGDIAQKTIHLDTPGACSENLIHFNYKNIPSDIEKIKVLKE